ncbi:REQUIRED FOR NUCLEAR DIVISION (SPINDLE POLE BODY DUPLICATION) CUT1_SCHPO [Encephalitozoon cuniculi GB-M1]|uniref:separase n=1 Tax=Encephalitozoon cuniculi (strain GB-M1) TaxID=284813 RepID=Q8SRL6_ENCCU|nr:uncharacterized protein ECU07_0350 [Encephalitozoon cuniculi GB-M1]CAD25567.1 REQUIRED FOR NUCLEAR DIVISION (SPINDLE POLE BODY DUPLICATION) CUT1_SCHPO [Encephalitozoon cuniculi GB-M1]
MLTEHQEEFLEKIRFKGKGCPCRATSTRRGTEAIRMVNSILKAPTRSLGLFGLEIVKCLYIYEPMLGIPRYSLDKALVSLCSKVFVREIYNEIERRIKLHLGRMLDRDVHSIDESMGFSDYNDSSLDEIIVGYLMIRYKEYGEYKKEAWSIVERVGPRLKAKAKRMFASLLAGCVGSCLLEEKIERLLDSRRREAAVSVEKKNITHVLTRDEVEYVRENYPLVSYFYNIPEDIGVPYLDLRRSFNIEYFDEVCCWNGFTENSSMLGGASKEKLLGDLGLLKDICFRMCRNREYDLELMRELIKRSTSFERAFMEGYTKVVCQEYEAAKEKLRMVLEIIRGMGMASIHEIQLCVYDLLSMSHMFCGEYFESVFYLNRGVELSCKCRLDFVAQHFLNCKLVVERIGGVHGPSPNIRLDLREMIDPRHVAVNEQKVVSNRVFTNLALKDEMSNLREIRTLERFAILRPSTLCRDIQRILRRLGRYTVMSLYCIDGSLYINDFKGFIRVDKDFRGAKTRMNRILARSRDILKENAVTGMDRARWWMQRIELDAELGKVLSDIGSKFNGLSVGKSVILVLDETTTEFPFESMPVFRNKAVYRVPSLEYLENASGSGASGRSFFYLLDPENNLPKTQERMAGFLESSGITNGVTGRPPSDLECKKADGCDVLLYFGHGSGLKYLKVSGEGKTMLLFGCSSVKLLCMENYKRNGAILKHLRRNSMVVGCLWEVTDKDIDSFSARIIGSLTSGCESLGELISRFRDGFRLKYLNGASVVIYGLH